MTRTAKLVTAGILLGSGSTTWVRLDTAGCVSSWARVVGAGLACACGLVLAWWTAADERRCDG